RNRSAEQAETCRQAYQPLDERACPRQGTESHADRGCENRQRQEEVARHSAASIFLVSACLRSVGGFLPGSASRMASVSTVPRRRWALSNRTAVKATSEKEITIAVRIRAWGSGLAPPTSAVSPAATSG